MSVLCATTGAGVRQRMHEAHSSPLGDGASLASHDSGSPAAEASAVERGVLERVSLEPRGGRRLLPPLDPWCGFAC
ncbi:uncharacterized protein LY79DRAFT_563714 [Colletotrichum navitas]|uniref:Uncharacterized protein n=1 Tax=Colletotrichum navitas TaxID=681940 RepID=A0AAD8PT58_9PEZI|nr:uncharacterized protein LY79DRAFT_563714 [Colletotrichum navitas]KAK1579572.1 hypothetical protein LY79DRAFT_563714 [Colletotrichum navitas]